MQELDQLPEIRTALENLETGEGTVTQEGLPVWVLAAVALPMATGSLLFGLFIGARMGRRETT